MAWYCIRVTFDSQNGFFRCIDIPQDVLPYYPGSECFKRHIDNFLYQFTGRYDLDYTVLPLCGTDLDLLSRDHEYATQMETHWRQVSAALQNEIRRQDDERTIRNPSPQLPG